MQIEQPRLWPCIYRLAPSARHPADHILSIAKTWRSRRASGDPSIERRTRLGAKDLAFSPRGRRSHRFDGRGILARQRMLGYHGGLLRLAWWQSPTGGPHRTIDAMRVGKASPQRPSRGKSLMAFPLITRVRSSCVSAAVSSSLWTQFTARSRRRYGKSVPNKT
jgi:hypothetical protein